jgi:hypothetical protein
MDDNDNNNNSNNILTNNTRLECEALQTEIAELEQRIQLTERLKGVYVKKKLLNKDELSFLNALTFVVRQYYEKRIDNCD